MTYWEKRELKAAQTLMDNSIEEIEKQLSKQYSATAKRLAHEIEILYREIKAAPDDVLISHRYTYDKYVKMVQKINAELKKLGSKEQILLKDELIKTYTENATRIGKEFGLASSINRKEVEKAVLQTWVGNANFSKRIWTNQAKLSTILQKELVNVIAAGRPTAELTKALAEGMGVGYSNARRLARTEIAHVYNSSTIDRYKEAGVDKVKILTAEDDKVCDQCKEFEGKVFDIDKAPVLPVHPQDRCCYVAVSDRLNKRIAEAKKAIEERKKNK